MPTYQYRCTECGRDLEVVQKFSDASLTECPTCAGELRKVFNAVGVVFKGSGFYRTDSRAAGAASNGSDSGEKSDKADKGAEKSNESTKPGSKPDKVSAASKSDSGSTSSGSGSEKVSTGSGSSSTGSKAAAK